VDGFPSVVAIRIHDHCFGKNYSPLYATGRYQAMTDIYTGDLEPCHTNILAQFQVRANLIMPLLCGERLWGLLCLHQCQAPRHWQQSDIDFVQQLANQLAIAIQQANLFEQLQQELADRQRAEAKLTESNHQLAISNQELARATRLKDEFLANMSHELRTPLNAILGMAEGLQEEVFGKITSQQVTALQTIERSGFHLLELINDILDVAKIESGQMQMDYAPTAIASLCQASLSFVKQEALKKHIQLEANVPHALPALWIDERRIRQVLINLLNNAVKFTPEGGRIKLDVKIQPGDGSPKPTGSLQESQEIQPQKGGDQPEHPVLETPLCWLHFSITDTGIGIAPEHIPRLFQPFIQIDSALNRQYAGTGLGLTLVKRIVELHGGRVGLTSEVGVGSCFTFELPCPEIMPTIASSSTSGGCSPHLPPSLTEITDPSSPLILLAEDNEANISTISSYLRAKGYCLLLAKQGQEAIDLAIAHRPDLILMDIQMPGMDGLEAIGQIRRHPDICEVPIIALTALALAGDRETCLAAGANSYLTKPVKLKHLVTTIQAFLRCEHST